VVTDRTEGAAEMESKGQARLLGDCVMEMGPLMPSLNDIYGVGVRQSLAFLRRRDDKEVVVGRFTCILKLVVSTLQFLKSGIGRLHDQVTVLRREEPDRAQEGAEPGAPDAP